MCLSETLTPRQKKFCNEYLVSFNAYQSAIGAGYSDSTARKGTLLHLREVEEYLRNAMNKTALRLQITHDMVLKELAKVAFSSMGNYYDYRGHLKPIHELTEDEKACLSRYELIDGVDKEGYNIGLISKIRLHNKMAALDKIAKHLGFYGVGSQKDFLSQKQEARSMKQGGLAGVGEDLTANVGEEFLATDLDAGVDGYVNDDDNWVEVPVGGVEPVKPEVVEEPVGYDLPEIETDGHIDENGVWVEVHHVGDRGMRVESRPERLKRLESVDRAGSGKVEAGSVKEAGSGKLKAESFLIRADVPDTDKTILTFSTIEKGTGSGKVEAGSFLDGGDIPDTVENILTFSPFENEAGSFLEGGDVPATVENILTFSPFEDIPETDENVLTFSSFENGAGSFLDGGDIPETVENILTFSAVRECAADFAGKNAGRRMQGAL